MATSGSATIIVAVAETLDTPENRSGTIYDAMRPVYSWTDGLLAGQNDLVWSDRRTVVAGATDTIDLNGGGLTDAFGNAVNFVEVTMIAIRNRETTAATRTLRFGPAAANPFLWLFVDASDQVVIVPSGAYCQWSDEAQTVTPGVSDSVRIINTDLANGVTYDIIVSGRSA
ncbi:hypothetical protein CMI37_19125 [Candidatus Pacearchaeota archaeon]|nr:hypothetical protein [Candidatus Pacearchaeota archaeon]|tara:strand:- start:2245 stop:2757 length:513 start_codon:yes stop_codon:yes gene_type:complete